MKKSKEEELQEIKALAKYLGKENLPNNRFIRNVAEQYASTNSISFKQSEALRKF